MNLRQKKNVFGIFALILIISISSCKKQKVLQDIAGTWKIESVLRDGEIDERTFDGTWTFNDCKLADNNKDGCDGVFNYSVSYMGNTQSATNSFKYATIKENGSDVQVIIEDEIYNISFPDSKLVLETTTADPVQKITFTK